MKLVLKPLFAASSLVVLTSISLLGLASTVQVPVTNTPTNMVVSNIETFTCVGSSNEIISRGFRWSNPRT
jgi:hypothetical protein